MWQNQPSTKTALGANNLNKMDISLNTIDDRVIELGTSKANQSTVNNTVESITFDESNGVLTITKVNGTSTTIDTKLEKLAVNFEYDPDEQQLIITLDDGTVQYVDMSTLVTQYEFLDTDTVSFFVESDGKIKAKIINGSITGEHMQPDYLADIIVQANIAIANARLSKRWAVGGVEEGDEEDNSKYYAEQAENAAEIAQEYSGIIYPNIYIDIPTGNLMSVGGENIVFTIDTDGNLISEVIV